MQERENVYDEMLYDAKQVLDKLACLYLLTTSFINTLTE